MDCLGFLDCLSCNSLALDLVTAGVDLVGHVAGVRDQNIDFAVEQMMSLGEEPEPSWPEFLEAFLKVRQFR